MLINHNITALSGPAQKTLVPQDQKRKATTNLKPAERTQACDSDNFYLAVQTTCESLQSKLPNAQDPNAAGFQVTVPATPQLEGKNPTVRQALSQPNPESLQLKLISQNLRPHPPIQPPELVRAPPKGEPSAGRRLWPRLRDL